MGSIPGLGSSSTVFALGQQTLEVAGVDLVIRITLQGNTFSMCSLKPVWVYRDKRKLDYEYMVIPENETHLPLIKALHL